MKLLHFNKNNELHIGVKTDKGIIDLKAAGLHFQEVVPDCLEDVINNDALSAIQKIVDRASTESVSSLYINEEEIDFLPSIVNPEKIICVGLNYLLHVEEGNENIPKSPVLFNKYNNTLAAHNESIPIPE